MKQKIKKRILPSILIACAVPLMAFLSTPIDIFSGNYNEFVFSFSNFFGICFVYFLISSIILFTILIFLPNKGYRVVSALLLGVAFMMFIQSNFLNGNLTTLKGDGEGSVISTTWMVFDVIIWVAVIALFVVLSVISDKKGIISTIGLILAAVVVCTQVVTPVFACITKRDMFLSANERAKKADSSFTHMLLTNKNLTTVASEDNIFVFCVDKFDENWLEQIYDKKPDLFDSLKGFTWYQDHISRYGHTYPSIINMLTENEFVTENEPTRTEFLKKALQNTPSLDMLHNEGWNINIYSEKFYSYSDAFYMPSYIQNISVAKKYKVTNPPLLGLNMVQLGLYRAMPFYLKELLIGVSSQTFSRAIVESDGQGSNEYRPANDVVDDWTDKQFTTVNGKGFYFIHTQGLHDSYDADKLIPNFEINIKIINRYINYLKQQGLYENATIIITGDHGNGTPYNKTKLTNSVRTGMFIKPSGKGDGEMQISQAQTSHTQLWATILEEAGANGGADFGTNIMEVQEGVDQVRDFTWHTYNCKLVEFKYVIHGSAREFDNWEKTSETTFGNRRMTD